MHDWTFLLGPNFLLGANSLLLAHLMYWSRLVPRFIAVLGLVGGPLILASATAVMFGLHDQISVWGSIAALPVFAWECWVALRRRGIAPRYPSGVGRRAHGRRGDDQAHPATNVRFGLAARASRHQMWCETASTGVR
jgi:hypothetical protein